jgi:hypothetical protein
VKTAKVAVVLLVLVALAPLWLPMLAARIAWGISSALDEEFGRLL